MPSYPTPATETRPVPQPGHAIRRLLATVGMAGALTLGGVALPATASAAEAPTAVGVSRVVTGFCPFGTHSGGGCRGGSINDNERANRAARETGKLYVDAAECAGRALGKSVVKNRKRLSLPSIGLGTVKPGIKCGQDKGY